MGIWNSQQSLKKKGTNTTNKKETSRSTKTNDILTVLLHPKTEDKRSWRHLALVLTLAFGVRATVGLSGDFVLHPDEIMQYLEPAHRLVFGNGITYWEYFYGARSWLVPGIVAGVLKLFDSLGLGQPVWYVNAVKLTFCAISLWIPAGMYLFARRHFGESTARIALVAGAFWYELIGFAHKPMTEFVATAPLMALLWISMRSEFTDRRGNWLAGTLAVFMAAIRIQYAPVALLLFTIVFFRTRQRIHLVIVTGTVLIGIGVFDAFAWNQGLFHSYITNLQYNITYGPIRDGESPSWQFLVWLSLAGTGLCTICIICALFNLRRYMFLLTLIALIVVSHSIQTHKEYRFIFATIPLWLLIGSDLVARLGTRKIITLGRKSVLKLMRSVTLAGSVWAGIWTSGYSVVSIGGILNMLPYQHVIYQAWSKETGIVAFIRNQDPIFDAYRYLGNSPNIAGVWQTDRHHHNLPGYYYLHHMVPFYDKFLGEGILTQTKEVPLFVSHIVSGEPDFSHPEFMLDQEFSGIRILRRSEDNRPVYQWKDERPVIISDRIAWQMRSIDPTGPIPPADMGVRFLSQKQR